MHQFILLFILGLCAVTRADLMECNSNIGKFTKVSVHGCKFNGTLYSCKSGRNLIIDVDFTISKPIKYVDSILQLTRLLALRRKPVLRREKIGGGPLNDTSKTYNCHYVRHIENGYKPRIEMVQFELRTEGRQKIDCYRFLVSVS